MKPHLQRGVCKELPLVFILFYTKRSVKKKTVYQTKHTSFQKRIVRFSLFGQIQPKTPQLNPTVIQPWRHPTFSDQGGESGGVHQRTHSYDFWWQMWQGMDGLLGVAGMIMNS